MTEENQSSAVRKHNNKWRVVDIVVAAIIAVASGVIFWGWDIVCTAPLALFEAVTPGFEGLLNAFWLFAGPLAAIIVRKPGAALFAETLAAALELTMGNQWGVGGSLIVGIIQGLGADGAGGAEDPYGLHFDFPLSLIVSPGTSLQSKWPGP